MQQLISRIQNLFRKETKYQNFPNFISQIHFPYYKGMVEKSHIDFNFPITVLVGQNGCGKSSVLQALETTPAGKSYSPRWFSTIVDPIINSATGQKPCYWYKYYNAEAGKIVEVLNTRIERKENLDYWEPSRPIIMHGMKAMPRLAKNEELKGRVKTRWNGVKRSVEYIDFRSELSAFDKYFYFESAPKKIRYYSKQDYIRFFSGYLKNVFTKHLSTFKLRNRDRLQNLTILLNEELQLISEILGKDYKSAIIAEHSFYKNIGTSIYFKTRELGYSEAFAGSGEMSVVKLVHKVFNAKQGSLILLDEPEVSLHPGAQSKLLKFLLKQVEEKRHQVVISTHSPAIVQNLPKEAVTVLTENGEGKFSAINGVAPELAFQYIGHVGDNRKKIIVEDDAALQLIYCVLKQEWGDNSENLVEIIFHAGGATDIYKEALVLSRIEDSKTFIYLDGDQFKTDVPESGEIADLQLDQVLENVTGIKPKSFQYCLDSGNEGQILTEKRNFLGFLKNRCFYLPGRDPEDTIWEASTLNFDKSQFQQSSYKERIKKWVESEVQDPTASDIKTYRKRLLNGYNQNNEKILSLKNGLQKILGL